MDKEALKIYGEFSTHRSLVPRVPGMTGDFAGIQHWGGLRRMGYGKQDRDDLPLLTVITVVKNNAGTIGECLESVIRQTYGNIELLVLDGGSDDGTVDIIKQFDDRIDLWISNPDGGIYDAMNRGLELATGRYVHFLNSDDYFSSRRSAALVMECFEKRKVRWIHANILMFNRKTGQGWIRYSNVSKYYYLFKGIPQQAFFFEKKLFDEYGNFNLEYRIVADLDFLLRIMIKQRIPGRYMNMPVVIFDTGGISGSMERKRGEREKVLRNYFPKWTLLLLRNKLVAGLVIRNERRSRKKSIFEKVF